MGLFDRDDVVAKANAFADAHFSESVILQWIAARGVPQAVYDDFYAGELGAYCLPKNLGGIHCSFADRAAVVAQLTRRAGATLPFLSDMLTYALLSTMRSLSQQEIVEDLQERSGRVFISQAFTEASAGTDANAVETSISLDGDQIVIDGCKTFVSNGQFASDTLILARDPIFGREDGGLALWLVPVDAPGVYTYPLDTVGQKMLAPARIEFDHVVLSPDWQIQTEGKLNSMLRRQYELGRILVCSSSLGLARAALDDATDHAKSHMVKGRCLGSIPAIQEKLAESEIKLRTMEMLVHEAACAADDGDTDEMHLNCALMKMYVPKAATEVASEALQIFGGSGYTTETRVSRIWRDCRGNQIAQGADEIMAHTAAKFLLK